MKSLLMILFFASCTTSKTVLFDGSGSKGNITKYEWRINGNNYQGVTTIVSSKGSFEAQLIVTDLNGLKDTAIKIIP